MIGDSITEEGLWEDFLPNVSIANRGISGDCAAAIRADLQILLGQQCEIVSLLLGTNDFLAPKSSVDVVFQDWKEIVEQLSSRDIRIVVTSTPLTIIPDANKKIISFNSQIERYCLSGSCKFVDLNSVIAPDGILGSSFTWDGIHLTFDGYRTWTDLLRPHLVNVDNWQAGTSRSVPERGQVR